MRPFRLLQYLRQERPRSHLPTILVRALPVPLGKTQEEQIRESYQNLGVDQFYNLYEEKQREGDEVALAHFREAVLRPATRAAEQFATGDQTLGCAGRLGGKSGGERGIRTLDTGLSRYNALAGRPLRPLGHLSGGAGILPLNPLGLI